MLSGPKSEPTIPGSPHGLPLARPKGLFLTWTPMILWIRFGSGGDSGCPFRMLAKGASGGHRGEPPQPQPMARGATIRGASDGRS